MPLLPVALYGLEVPAGDVLIPAVPDFPATFRITMAAIDPSETVDPEDAKRATLKLIRQPIGPRDDDDDDSEDDYDEEEYMRAILAGPDSDDEEEEEEEEANGGPSDPAKTKKAQRAAALEELLNSLDKESDDEMEDAPNGVNGVKKSEKKKGKAKATDVERDEEEDDDSEEEEDDEEDLEIEEFVICTLDPERLYQQPLDITIGEDERVFFKVSGGYAVHLTGNYVIPDDQGHNHHHEVYDSDEEDDESYDLTPDEDELELELEDDDSDSLDALEDPRVTEVDSEEETPKLVSKPEKKHPEKKGKNKRAAEEIEDGDTLDDLIAKTAKHAEAPTNGETKLSKKQLKKLKNNSGEAITTKAEEVKKSEPVKESQASTKSDKKVQFAKNLEQGPTGSVEKKKEEVKADGKDSGGKTTLGVKTVKGVKIDDRELGSGPAAKKGDRVGMRYIGKLTDGKVFDSNKKGKPFSFKLGVGEVIQGWDIGVVGMSVGGQRRLTIPSNLAYGNKSLPGIPTNSTLVFDIKLLEIK